MKQMTPPLLGFFRKSSFGKFLYKFFSEKKIKTSDLYFLAPHPLTRHLRELNRISTFSSEQKFKQRFLRESPDIFRHNDRYILSGLLLKTAFIFISVFQISVASAHPADSSFTNLARLLEPSVVNISVIKKSGLNTFFPGFAVPTPHISGSGSGFVIDSKGLIVTNTHVVSGADEIKVQFAGQPGFFKAKLVGKDDLSDIALLKIKPKKYLPPVRMGNSSVVQVGEEVAAFGNPHGYGHSMTQGIISAVKREIDDLNLFPLLQTDASINPGNSGGPLVNLKGEVVGVNNAIAAGAQGISFAIPIDNVKNILSDLKQYGYVQRGFIGVQLSSGQGGALILNVVTGGPAERAGIKAYDLIVQFGKKAVKSARDLVKSVATTPIGKKVPVQIVRDGKKEQLFVTVQRVNASSFNFQKPPPRKGRSGVKSSLGFDLIDPDPGVFKQFNLPDLGAGHPVVFSVKPATPAGKAGFRPGDLIFKVNGHDVAGVNDFKKHIKRSGNTLHILRYHRLYGQYLAFVVSF